MQDLGITVFMMLLLVCSISAVSVWPEDSEQSGYYQYAAVFPFEKNMSEVARHVIDAGGYPVRHGISKSIIVSASQEGHLFQRFSGTSCFDTKDRIFGRMKFVNQFIKFLPLVKLNGKNTSITPDCVK